MKALAIEKGRGRVYYDPKTRYLRIDHDGAGPGMELTAEEAKRLSRALWYSTG